MAFSMLLLVVAGLFGRAMARAHAIDPGFDPHNVQVTTLDLRLVNHTSVTGRQFVDRLMAGASALPGAERVAMTRMIPARRRRNGARWDRGRGTAAPDPRKRGWNADWNIVTPAYFDVMRIPLLKGRDFADTDRAGAPDVAIINETLAPAYLAGRGSHRQDVPQRRSRRHRHRHRTRLEVPRRWVSSRVGSSTSPSRSGTTTRCRCCVRMTPGTTMAAPIRRLLADLDPALPILNAADDGDTCGDRPLPAAHRPVGGRDARRRGAAAGPDRHLRCHGVRRDAADARDRHPHRVRLVAWRGTRPGDWAGCPTGRNRYRVRHRSRDGGDATAGESPVRGHRNRSNCHRRPRRRCWSWQHCSRASSRHVVPRAWIRWSRCGRNRDYPVGRAVDRREG